MTYICPECHKSLKHKHSLHEHMKTVHPDKAGLAAKAKPPAVAKATHKAKKFVVKPVKEKPLVKDSYKCGACGASLDGEISPCPACGASLTWS